MTDTKTLKQRRQLLIATSGAGAVAAAATAVPFVASLTPSDRARAAGAPVQADVSKLAPGEMMTVEWRGKPVWILHRTPEMLASLEAETLERRLADPESVRLQQPPYATNRHRSIHDRYLVVIGICTHLGCSPTAKLVPGAAGGMAEDWPGGFFCPCHGSHFDLAGRVFLSQPAPTNLVVPPYKWLSDAVVLIGEDDGVTA
ncbi:MAG TPA: ubiquinol-cytochrome c reductase iron-sulfur subunit [Azoarcus taiwanensis]|uniref:Ubiquinol-cytochrome c reductase iron-sulfur subunit n=1 Tax=Azoarcus taiwanensis TaxID=666964 RepID=A0A972JB06_9RHOO|nr:ubiquinol-cytochrome c reductase iron-sulfur subunit [Azoarcus taiwanensis]NMG03623.1 ubiquinol-cytochrome c reductase iron-sulfur subunit [Azoarcus taiwanensis]HRQ57402.1 ubiquinol-cytochrome c reductase iron-sulfur subunit [Azoarcus taiwanensis]